MNVNNSIRFACVLGTVLLVNSGAAIAQAETVEPGAADLLMASPASVEPSQTAEPEVVAQTMVAPSQTSPAADLAQTDSEIRPNEAASPASELMLSEPAVEATEPDQAPESALDATTEVAPVEPGVAAPEETAPPATAQSDQDADDRSESETISQGVDIDPGRATRSGPSYIGVGGNLGLGDGDSAVGEGSFAVFSKIGLTPNISARPGVLFSDDPTILLPVTFDFIPGVTEVTEDLSGEIGLRVSPFVGAGVAIATGDDGGVDFLLTGGVDLPISTRFTATATVNATVFDNTAVGLLLGLGYNF